MEQTGIEPVSSDFQSVALTNFAIVPFWVTSGFEPCSSHSQWDVLPNKLKTPYLENPIGLEPIPQESNSCMLTIYITGLCTPPWIRTKTTRGLNPMPLPVGLVEHSMGREIRTLRFLILNQVRLPFSPSPHLIFVFRRGIEPLIPHRKCGVLTIWPTEHFCLRSRIRTCDLSRPRRVNNHRYLPRYAVLTGFEPATFRETVGCTSHCATVLFVEVAGLEPTSSDETRFTVWRANQLLNTSIIWDKDEIRTHR